VCSAGPDWSRDGAECAECEDTPQSHSKTSLLKARRKLETRIQRLEIKLERCSRADKKALLLQISAQRVRYVPSENRLTH